MKEFNYFDYFEKSPEDIRHDLDLAKINELIDNAPPLFKKEREPAPFSNFDKNTNESWEYVPKEKVENYLRERLFFNTLMISTKSAKETLSIHVERNEETIKIPLDLVVYAASFQNWEGRPKQYTKSWNIVQNGKSLSGNMPSIDVAKLYAGTPSKLPPVRKMNMYIQPNKKIFFDNGSGDSHRIAAAILRGQKTIETRGVTVYELSENYLQ